MTAGAAAAELRFYFLAAAAVHDQRQYRVEPPAERVEADVASRVVRHAQIDAAAERVDVDRLRIVPARLLDLDRPAERMRLDGAGRIAQANLRREAVNPIAAVDAVHRHRRAERIDVEIGFMRDLDLEVGLAD